MTHSTCNPPLLLLGRILLAAIFAMSAFGKITGFEQTAGFMAGVGIPLPEVALVIAIILEVVGVVLLVLGWKALWGAIALIVFTVLATVFFHLDFSDQNNQIAFLKNLGLIGGLLYVIVAGAGSWSLDARTRSQSSTPQV